MKLYEYAIRRILLMGLVLFGISLLMFYLTRGFLPPTFALVSYLTPRMTDPQKLALAKSLGVATSSCPTYQAFSAYQPSCLVPIYEQYGGWVTHVLAGNWGYSLIPGLAGSPTTLSVFFSRFPYTAELAVMGAILTILIGIPLGVISATHNNKWPDHISRVVSLGGYSIPQFWFGYVLLIIFVLDVRVGGFGILPGSGPLATTCAICFANPGTVNAVTGAPIIDGIIGGNFKFAWDSFVALILPTITLSITSIGALTRIVRSSMLEVLKQDYITLARSKGLADRVVIYRHALRNALLPAVTVAGLLTAFLFGGVVVIEIVFDLPGVGYTALQAVNVFDINFIELYVLVTAFIIVVANLAVDIIYAKLDPKDQVLSMTEIEPKTKVDQNADLRLAFRLFRQNPFVLVGLVLSSGTILLAILSPFLVNPHSALITDSLIKNCWNNPLFGWGNANIQKCPTVLPLGTDSYGRNLLSMIVLAVPTDLRIALEVVFSAVAIGVFFGAIASYAGGLVDEVILRVTDIFLAVPGILLAIVFMVIFGRTLTVLTAAVALIWWPTYVRLVRSQALSEKEKPYVESLRAIGAGRVRILFRHIVPNSIYPLLVQATLDIGSVILTVSALTFIGLSPSPYLPELGNLASLGSQYFFAAPWLIIFPGLTILLISLGFNLLGDGLRDILDPRLRR